MASWKRVTGTQTKDTSKNITYGIMGKSHWNIDKKIHLKHNLWHHGKESLEHRQKDKSKNITYGIMGKSYWNTDKKIHQKTLPMASWERVTGTQKKIYI